MSYLIVISKVEFVQAEKLAIRTMHQEMFKTEYSMLKQGKAIKTGPLAQTKLYIDKSYIISVMLHFVRQTHRCYNCSGVMGTMKNVMKTLYCVKLKKLVIEIVKNCLI